MEKAPRNISQDCSTVSHLVNVCMLREVTHITRFSVERPGNTMPFPSPPSCPLAGILCVCKLGWRVCLCGSSLILNRSILPSCWTSGNKSFRPFHRPDITRPPAVYRIDSSCSSFTKHIKQPHLSILFYDIQFWIGIEKFGI